MATFLGHSAAVTQLQSHQRLLLQQGASSKSKGLSAKHTQHLQHRGREPDLSLAPRRQPNRAAN